MNYLILHKVTQLDENIPVAVNLENIAFMFPFTYSYVGSKENPGGYTENKNGQYTGTRIAFKEHYNGRISVAELMEEILKHINSVYSYVGIDLAKNEAPNHET